MPSTSSLKARTSRIIAHLEKEFGRPGYGERKDPLSELVFTILSQHTSDGNRDRAWASLWKEFESWEEVAGAKPSRIEKAIRSGGLAPTKSRVIKSVLERVKKDQGKYSLDLLDDMGMEEAERYLRSFKGVGIKTIRCVQVFSLHQPAFPVDTHIFRITKRLELVPEKADPEAAHRIMQSLTPSEEVLPFHMNLITLGRRICKAGRPLCESCILRRSCPWFRKNRAA